MLLIELFCYNQKVIKDFTRLLMSQVLQQEALTKLLVEKGIFTKEESLEIAKIVSSEINRKIHTSKFLKGSSCL